MWWLHSHSSRLKAFRPANGSALAGGLELLLGCDLRVVAAGAKLGLPEVTVGLLAVGGGCSRLPKQLPYVVAMEMLLVRR